MNTLIPDEPIKSAIQDRLNRAQFAESLADRILSSGLKECVVIGIHGLYGSGKSSFLNLVDEKLQKIGGAKDLPPTIVRFNPWNFSTAEQLIVMFFATLSRELRRKDKSVATERIAKNLELLGNVLAPMDLIPVVGQAAKAVSMVAKSSAKMLAARKSETPESIKEELRKLLERQKHQLVVLVDDIDRMEPEKIQILFRVIKLNADFPFTTYLLAFDRKFAEKALDREGFPGRAYLEKIVQVSFDLPMPEEGNIADLLSEELDDVLALSSGGEEGWDTHRWTNLYLAGFGRFFKTIRDVKRYINALRLTFAGQIRAEVNPVDFVMLEAIRIFCPDAYALMPNMKESLTKTERPFARPDDMDQERKAVEEIFQFAAPFTKEARQICLELFPPIHRFFRGSTYRPTEQSEWRKQRRVCAEGVFDKYFLLGVPSRDIADAEVRRIVALAGEERLFEQELRNLNKLGLCLRFLDRFTDFTGEFPPERVNAAVKAILNISDELPHESEGLMSMPQGWLVVGVMFQLLRRIEPPEERLRICLDAMDKTPSIRGQLRLAHFLQRESDKSKQAFEEPLLTEEGEREVKEAALTHIRRAAQKSRLRTAPELGQILGLWGQWADPKEPKTYVNEIISTDKGLALLLTGFLHKLFSQSGYERAQKARWAIDREGMSRFVDLDEIAPRVRSLAANLGQFSEQEKAAITAFLDPKDLRRPS